MADFSVSADVPPIVAEMPAEEAADAVLFDNFASDYDGFYQTEMGKYVFQAETQAAMDLLAPKAGDAILDVGCGTGLYSHYLAEKGAKVTGIDLSHEMLAEAQAKDDGPTFKIMNVEKMDFPDASFDKVISMAAFEFMDDVNQAYAEIMRVLRPGGIAVIGTIAGKGAWAKAYKDPNLKDAPYYAANFQAKEDMIALDPQAVTGIAECLFIPPNYDRFSMEEEQRLSEIRERGGFIVIRYQKK